MLYPDQCGAFTRPCRCESIALAFRRIGDVTVYLQAIALSLLDSTKQPLVHETKGCPQAGLEPAVSWFCKEFSVLSPQNALKQARPRSILD